MQLGYAGTVHAAQGRTVTTARGLVTDTTTAEALYVMMSRGQRSNDAYVVTDHPDREAHQRWPARHHLSVLAGILERDDHPAASVADVQRDRYEQTGSLARLRIIFGDLSTRRARRRLPGDHRPARQPRCRSPRGHRPGLGHPRRAVGSAQLRGWDAHQLLSQAVTQRELGTADDVAAVLHWRCVNITRHDRRTPDPPAMEGS